MRTSVKSLHFYRPSQPRVLFCNQLVNSPDLSAESEDDAPWQFASLDENMCLL